MVKIRGLKETKIKLGDLEKIISNSLKKKKKVRIFESGCGYGKVMIELKKKFGDKIEIIGMNYKKIHGDKKKIISFALKEGIITKKEVKQMQSIKVIFGDAGKKLPFKTSSIDLVYSQTSSYLYKDKMHFFEEVARILSKEGIARITNPEKNPKLSEEFRQLLRIYDKNKQIPFDKFIRKFKNIRKVKLSSGQEPIEVKGGKLNFGLKLKSTIDVHNFRKDWFGIISTYSV
jgi:ubiquinone/menaquinone biosynthesis C-methylase UbiE